MDYLKKIISQKENFRVPSSGNYFIGKTLNTHIIPNNVIAFIHDANQLSNISDIYTFNHRNILIIPLLGEGIVGVDRNFHKLYPGNAMLILPYQLHFFPAIQNNSQWLIITFEMGSDNLSHLKNTVRHVSKDFRQLAACCALAYKKVNEEIVSNLELIYQFDSLISSFAKKPPESLVDSFEDPKWNRAYEILNKVSAFVEQNLTSDISAAAIADHFNLAKNYLGSLFRDSFGITLGQYVTNLKIQKATELLLLTDLPMNIVAEKSGFDNPISFNRAFKRIMQFPPAKYRTLVKKD